MTILSDRNRLIGWIPVKERLPDSTSQSVLVYADGQIWMGQFSAVEFIDITDNTYRKEITFGVWPGYSYCSYECREISCENCSEEHMILPKYLMNFKLDKITHWMPLPDKPLIY